MTNIHTPSQAREAVDKYYRISWPMYLEHFIFVDLESRKVVILSDEEGNDSIEMDLVETIQMMDRLSNLQRILQCTLYTITIAQLVREAIEMTDSYLIQCPTCQVTYLSSMSIETKVLGQMIEEHKDEFTCAFCGGVPNVAKITPEKLQELITSLENETKKKIPDDWALVCLTPPAMYCPKCGGLTTRRLFGRFRQCNLCGRWCRTKNAIITHGDTNAARSK